MPAHLTQLLSPNDPQYLEHLRRSVIQLLEPRARGERPQIYPAWLSGDRASNLPGFLEDVVRESTALNRVTQLAILTPEHPISPSHVLADAFEQLHPALKPCDILQIPPAGWAAMVKGELANSPKRGHMAVIIDHTELIFGEAISNQERINVFRILCELAESPFASVLFVIDRTCITCCRTIRFLDPSLDAPSHIRIPISGQPLPFRPRRMRSPAPAIDLPLQRPGVRLPHPQPLDETFPRTLAWRSGAACALALILIFGIVVFGGRLRNFTVRTDADPAPKSVSLGSKPNVELTPVSSDAAKPFSADGSLKLEAFLFELGQTEGPDPGTRIQSALNQLQTRFPGHSTAEIETWLDTARSSSPALSRQNQLRNNLN